jgi:hypothetical protein
VTASAQAKRSAPEDRRRRGAWPATGCAAPRHRQLSHRPPASLPGRPEVPVRSAPRSAHRPAAPAHNEAEAATEAHNSPEAATAPDRAPRAAALPCRPTDRTASHRMAANRRDDRHKAWQRRTAAHGQALAAARSRTTCNGLEAAQQQAAEGNMTNRPLPHEDCCSRRGWRKDHRCRNGLFRGCTPLPRSRQRTERQVDRRVNRRDAAAAWQCL